MTTGWFGGTRTLEEQLHVLNGPVPSTFYEQRPAGFFARVFAESNRPNPEKNPYSLAGLICEFGGWWIEMENIFELLQVLIFQKQYNDTIGCIFRKMSQYIAMCCWFNLTCWCQSLLIGFLSRFAMTWMGPVVMQDPLRLFIRFKEFEHVQFHLSYIWQGGFAPKLYHPNCHFIGKHMMINWLTNRFWKIWG